MTVVVVGGGIVGMAAAYYLARASADVVVCERSHPGAGSTERALGGIRAQFSTPANIQLSRRAIDVWTAFEDRFDVDISYRQHGYLFLTGDEATAEAFERRVAVQREYGVPSEFITPDRAREHLPALHADRYVAATYSPEDGTADPHLALEGFAAAARAAGVEIRGGTEVTDINTEDGAVVGVETTGGRVRAEAVVNAAGPWAGRIAAMAGVSVPVTRTRRQIAVVEPSTPYPESAPLTVDIDGGVHFAPDRAGDAMIGGHFGGADPDRDPDAFPTDVDLDWVTTALERAAVCAGYFGAETRFKSGWSGLYTMTPDHHPIIEESVPGFVQAIGFSGHGFMHAPATGQVIADLVLRGTTSVVDIERFRRDRFDGSSPAEESAVI